MKKIIYKPIVTLFTVGLMMVTSCSKNEGTHGDGTGAVTQREVTEIKKVIANLPHFKAVKGSIIVKDGNYVDGGWDFSNPGSGYHYSSPSGISYSASSNTFTLASTGGGNAGGTVVAGSSSLDMNYSFCFSTDYQVDGLSAIAGGSAPTSNVAGVIGVSGDFDKLSSPADFADVFHGLAYYIVFSNGPASGDYKVLDWNDPKYSNLDPSSNSNLDKKCFAVVVDFKKGGLYMSTGGKINVSGGMMNFNGEYYAVTGYKVDANGNFDTSSIKVSKVPGFGAMGCN